MTFSPLINGTLPHGGKYHSRNGTKITRVLQHHHAATSDAGVNRLIGPDQASANYVIMTDGRILGQVPEEFRAWTSGSYEADAPSITIEVQNSGGQINGNDNDPGSWAISSAAYGAIVRLTADVAKRHKWGGVGAANYRGHREFGSTACPGGYIWARMGGIRTAANALAVGKVTTPAPVSKPVAKPVVKTIAQLADEVIAGKYGSGDARVRALGSKYAAVQAEVNRKLAVKAAPKPLTISQMADKVIRGEYGTGEARKKALGANYAAVQAEVNRRYA